MSTLTHRARLACAAIVGVACAGLVGGTPAVAGTVNGDPSYLVVYNNNLENQTKPECGYDWNKLFTYIKAQPKSPDIFTVQQISNQAALDALTARMSAELPGDYDGVIAIPQPRSLSNYDDSCTNPPASPKYRYKATQTNAVIYRTDRFTPVSEIRWRSDAPNDQEASSDDCRNLDKDNGDADLNGSNQDRVENVAVRLTDRVANKDVTVASFHWPTSDPWHGPYCAEENMQEAEDRTAELGGALTVLGGDANAWLGRTGSGTWWQDAVADGFRDPIGGTCAANCPTSANTSGSHRIDFLLVKAGHGFTGATTISATATGGKYSDHLALRADVKY